ncbi:shematrin-like protein 1 [Achroia grisella]|uniref:shematrin-like protein 1 n=1 Tax=Achroia grisella TaxID=688607 RepID=UPI0027D21D5D|nr:shematrin-like protein 1 [Achroia grisella]
MIAKIIFIFCFISVAYCGSLQNQAWNLGRHGTIGTYSSNIPSGYGSGLGYNGYGIQSQGNVYNPTNYGTAVSHVSIVKEISAARPYNNGGIPYSNLPITATRLPYSGVGTGLPNSNAVLPYVGAAVNHAGIVGQSLGVNSLYNGIGYSQAGAGYYGGAAGYPNAITNNYNNVNGYSNVGVATSYSNIYRGPQQAPAYGSNRYSAYGNNQVW